MNSILNFLSEMNIGLFIFSFCWKTNNAVQNLKKKDFNELFSFGSLNNTSSLLNEIVTLRIIQAN